MQANDIKDAGQSSQRCKPLFVEMLRVFWRVLKMSILTTLIVKLSLSKCCRKAILKFQPICIKN